MDDLRELAKLKAQQEMDRRKKREVVEVDKPMFSLADPNSPRHIRLKSIPPAESFPPKESIPPAESLPPKELPPIEELLPIETREKMNKAWEKSVAQKQKSNRKDMDIHTANVLSGLDNYDDAEIYQGLQENLNGLHLRGANVRAIDKYLSDRGIDMIFAEPDLGDDENYYFELPEEGY